MDSKFKNKPINKFIRKNKIRQIIALNKVPFELNLDSYILGLNEEFKLRPKVMTKATLEWESDNEDIAIVDNNGNITPVSIGTCNIICKKGNGIASCELTIENEETIEDLILTSYKYGIEVKNNEPVMYGREIENPYLTITGDVAINNGAMIFDGTQTVRTNGVPGVYGFGTKKTLETQRIYIRFKIDEYPAAGMAYNLLKYNDNNYTKINEYGNIVNGSVVSPFTIPTGEWVDLIMCVGNIGGWGIKFIYKDNVMDTVSGGGVTWGIDLSIGNNSFKGEIKFISSHYNDNFSKVNAFDDVKYKPTDDFVLNKQFNHISSTISDSKTRNILDKDISLPLEMRINPVDQNKVAYGFTFTDNSKFTYDLEELDEYGYVTKVYKNYIVNGSQKVVIDNDYDTPQRWYKYLRLRDNFNKKYIELDDLGISTVDNTITNNNDGIPAYVHISPARIASRVGKYVLMQPTFAPYSNYKDPRCEWKSSDESIAVIDEDGLVTCKSKGTCTITAVPVCNKALKATATIVVKEALDESLFPMIDIDTYNIVPNSEDKEICHNNVINIQNALFAYKKMGHKGCKLPNNLYNINSIYNDTTKCINIPSNFVFDMNGSTFNQLGDTEGTHNHVFNIAVADNSVLKNGIVYGDRYTHNYGIRINENPGSYEEGLPNSVFESGTIDSTTGLPIDDETKVRTKNFITEFPSKPFKICPLWNTSMSSVDGGRAFVYWYDADDNFISYADRQFIGDPHKAPEGATKMKIVIRSEKRLDPVFYMTTNLTYPTHEFASGIQIGDSFNLQIENMILKDFQGDCILTHNGNKRDNEEAVNDLRVINCVCENGRRQGLSFVATQDNCLIKGCKIGRINGTDPQCGIDFEAYSRNEKFLIDDCDFYDNRKWDIVDCYSGQIEVRNSRFNGMIGLGQSSYNWYIHDNEFIYDEKFKSDDYVLSRYKIHNTTGFNLLVNNSNAQRYHYSIAENNMINGSSKKIGSGTCGGSARNKSSKNNIAYNATLTVAGGESINDKIYGDVSINNDYGGEMINFTFDAGGGNGIYSARSRVTTIKESTLKNIHMAGIARIEDSVLSDNRSITSDNNTNDGGNPLQFINCDITNTANMNIASSFAGKCRFEGCNIHLTRSSSRNVFYHHDIGFKDCVIDFSADGPEGSVNWLWAGYGDYRCAMWFENCTFIGAEGRPIVINTNNYDDNCKFEGSAVGKTKTVITDFTMNDINGLEIAKNTQVDLGVNLLPSNILNIFLDVTPLTNQILLNTGSNNATESKLNVGSATSGNYHLKFYTKDGSNIVKEFDITVL